MADPMNDPNQQQQQTTEPFRTFETQEEFDNFSANIRKKAEEKFAKDFDAKYRKDLEASIREDIEKKAKMSEEEKLAEERAKLQNELKEQKISFNKEVAKDMLSKSGFEEEEMDMYLDFVTDDKDLSIGKIKRICDSRKSFQDKQKASIIEELSQSNPQIKIQGDQKITQKEARDMSIADMTKLKQENPELYEQTFHKK